MRKTMLLLAIFGLTGSLWAQSPFDGTWKIDYSNAKIVAGPYTWVIQNNTYQCSACGYLELEGPIIIRTDGTDQPLQGRQKVDTLAVKIVDDTAIEVTEKKVGRLSIRLKIPFLQTARH